MRYHYRTISIIAILISLLALHVSAITVAEDVWNAASMLFVLDLLLIVVWVSYVIWKWLKSPWGDCDIVLETSLNLLGNHPTPGELVLAEVEEDGVISYRLLKYQADPPLWVGPYSVLPTQYPAYRHCCPVIRWVYVSDIFRV